MCGDGTSKVAGFVFIILRWLNIFIPSVDKPVLIILLEFILYCDVNDQKAGADRDKLSPL